VEANATKTSLMASKSEKKLELIKIQKQKDIENFEKDIFDRIDKWFEDGSPLLKFGPYYNYGAPKIRNMILAEYQDEKLLSVELEPAPGVMRDTCYVTLKIISEEEWIIKKENEEKIKILEKEFKEKQAAKFKELEEKKKKHKSFLSLFGF
jgi:hypothetical protein